MNLCFIHWKKNRWIASFMSYKKVKTLRSMIFHLFLKTCWINISNNSFIGPSQWLTWPYTVQIFISFNIHLVYQYFCSMISKGALQLNASGFARYKCYLRLKTVLVNEVWALWFLIFVLTVQAVSAGPKVYILYTNCWFS